MGLMDKMKNAAASAINAAQDSLKDSPQDAGNDDQLHCPKCKGTNVIVQIAQDGEKTSRKGVGLGGHVNNAARGLTAVATLGASNLVWKKSEGTNKTKVKNKAVGVCQTCGNMWDI